MTPYLNARGPPAFVAALPPIGTDKDDVQGIVDRLRGLGDALDLDEVSQVYLPLSQLLSLRVQDVDFMHRTVRIEWQLAPGSKVRTAPKTSRSTRTIPLPQVVAEALSMHLSEFPLRHHYASVLLAQGESVVAVAERLGITTPAWCCPRTGI